MLVNQHFLILDKDNNTVERHGHTRKMQQSCTQENLQLGKQQQRHQQLNINNICQINQNALVNVFFQLQLVYSNSIKQNASNFLKKYHRSSTIMLIQN